MTVHLASLDHLEHGFGPFSPEANAALEQVDAEVGELEAAAPNAVVCVLSDHGFTRTDHSFNLTRPFVEEGLKNATSWTAYPDVEGGSAAIILKDPKDEATRAKVEKLLHRLAADPKNGISQILDRKQIAAFGGRPDAAFWVDMQSNFQLSPKVGGAHGYAPSNPQLFASFFIAGPKIKSGVDLGEIDMRSIAATLAQVMGVPFPSADLPALHVFKVE
jgi:predicted AlkP superfamily pyrophosphatase or phosphodiesterase